MAFVQPVTIDETKLESAESRDDTIVEWAESSLEFAALAAPESPASSIASTYDCSAVFESSTN